jgi:hypothetical protein
MIMNEGRVSKKWKEASTNYRGPAILNGALGPNMLHIFLFLAVPLFLGCPKNVLSQGSETILGGLEKKKYKRKKGSSLKNE